MFDFEGEVAEGQPRSRWLRAATVSGAFIAMIALTVAGMVLVGLVLFWVIDLVQKG